MAKVKLKATKLGIIRQLSAVLSLSFSIIIMGTMLGWPAPVLRRIRDEKDPFPLGPEEISWMVSLVYLGNLMSPLPVGYLMEFIGRKAAMLMMCVVPLSSWVIILYARGAIQLYIARILSGIWCAAVTTITPMYLSEIAEPKLRGILITFIQFDTNVGVLYVYAIGPFVSYELLAVLAAAFPLLFLVFFWNMPESPYWLSMKERDEKALHALAWLRGDKVQSTRVLDEIHELSLGVHEEMQSPKNFKILLASKGRRKALIIVQYLAFAQRMSGVSSVLAFMSITLPKKDVGLLSVDYCVIVVGAVWTVAVVFSSYLLDSWGRKPLLILSSIGSCLGTFIVGTWFFFDEITNIDVSSVHWVPFAGLVVYSAFFSLGLGPVPTTEQGELFSANDRALASAITAMTLALTSFFSNQIYIPLYQAVGMFINYWIFAMVSAITAIFVHFYVIETKGKTLHEIHEELDQ